MVLHSPSGPAAQGDPPPARAAEALRRAWRIGREKRAKLQFQSFQFRSLKKQPPNRTSLAVQLDDELLVYGQLDFVALGNAVDARGQVVAINGEPRRRCLVTGELTRLLHDGQLAAALADGHFVAGPDRVRRDVHLVSVHLDVPVPHQLARLTPRDGEA